MLTNQAISLASELAARYRISSIQPLIASCRELADTDELSLAVTGRFKAGKSSFLNHLLGRDLLPVGVIPVTTVVTEIIYGPGEKATVHFLDGQAKDIPLSAVREFVAESGNPGNEKLVASLKIELPALERFRLLRFVDMPGLESALAQNTETALAWLPNVGLALVAISVDPPLSQQDLALLKRIYEYTPKVSILLTKVDLVSDAERTEIQEFISDQLMQAFGFSAQIFPYSIRPGYEHLKTNLQNNIARATLAHFQEHRAAVRQRKALTVLRECHDYLMLALKSAETLDSDREALKRQVIGEKGALNDLTLELRLVVNHTALGLREVIAKQLGRHQQALVVRLLAQMRMQFPEWSRSLGHSLESFETWLNNSLSNELSVISSDERHNLLAPLERLSKQILRTLQNFRDRLSERTLQVYGIALRTTELEIQIEEPQTPDISVGRIFDRNWELLSPVAPMWLVGRLAERHFARRLPYIVEKNLSRLTSQWDESIRAEMVRTGKEAEQRFAELISTVEQLIATSSDGLPKLREDLEQVDSSLVKLQEQ